MFPLGFYPLLLNRRHFAIFTVLKRSLGQGNVFRPVCLFTGGGGLPTGGLHPVGSAQEGLHLGCATRGICMGGCASRGLHSGVREVCIQRGVVSLPLGTRKVDRSHPTVNVFSFSFVFICFNLRSGSRIFQTGGGGTNPKRGGTKLYVGHFPPKNCMKLKTKLARLQRPPWIRRRRLPERNTVKPQLRTHCPRRQQSKQARGMKIMRQIERVMSSWKPPVGVNTSANYFVHGTRNNSHHGTTVSALCCRKAIFSHLTGK